MGFNEHLVCFCLCVYLCVFVFMCVDRLVCIFRLILFDIRYFGVINLIVVWKTKTEAIIGGTEQLFLLLPTNEMVYNIHTSEEEKQKLDEPKLRCCLLFDSKTHLFINRNFILL